MEKTTGTRTGRKPKSDPADRKYSFRLNAEENTRFEKLLADSGAGDRTLFIKKSIFSGQIKVVKIDKATMDYYIKLTEFHRHVIRCHQMSYQTLFTNRLSLSNFAKSESDDGKELTSSDHSVP